jgi:hypothetical protein
MTAAAIAAAAAAATPSSWQISITSALLGPERAHMMPSSCVWFSCTAKLKSLQCLPIDTRTAALQLLLAPVRSALHR